MDQRLHIRHGLHAVAVKFQSFRLPEHIALPFLFRKREEHLHKILIKIPQSLAVQLIVDRQLIQQLAGFLLHCLRTSRLQQLLPCTDLRDTEHFRCFFRWAAQQNTAFQGHVLAPLLQQLLVDLRCLFKGLRPLRIKSRLAVDILRTRTLQIIQLPGDIICLQRLPHPAL